MIRKTLFWIHLALGLAAGLAIAIMSFTGAALAFEKEMVGWAERDVRRVEPPAANATPRSVEELLQGVRVLKPEARVVSITLPSDARSALAVGLPNNVTVYVNPYTGEAREGQSPRMRAFLQFMRAWHVRLNFTPTPGRPTLGAQLNAAANFVFLFLCVSGLVLWWPRAWNARVLRPSLWFVSGARGKARDWNWHNVFGFWSLPVLLVLVASGVVLSYGWANRLVFRLAGEEPPTQGGAPRPPGATPGAGTTPRTPSDTPKLRVGELVQRLQAAYPRSEQLTLRFSPPLALAGADFRPAAPTLTVALRSSGDWPPFALSTLTVDASSGAVRRTENFADLSTGMRARRWLRLLHTGEALRWPGQLVAGLACLAGCVLVWTGFSLAWRRFFSPARSGPAA
jgi:uncharacterized iron-regulated membrane protein